MLYEFVCNINILFDHVWAWPDWWLRPTNQLRLKPCAIQLASQEHAVNGSVRHIAEFGKQKLDRAGNLNFIYNQDPKLAGSTSYEYESFDPPLRFDLFTYNFPTIL